MNVYDILQKTNYFISYNFSDENHAEIFISWKNQRYIIKWDDKTQTLTSTFNDLEIKAPRYAAAPIAYAILHQICMIYKYPYSYVFFHLEGNIAKTFFFDICQNNEDIQKTLDLQMITEGVVKAGLQKEDVELARTFDLYTGLKAVSDYYLNTGVENE